MTLRDAMLEWDKRLAAREGMPGPDEEWFRSGQGVAVAGLRQAIGTLK